MRILKVLAIVIVIVVMFIMALRLVDPLWLAEFILQPEKTLSQKEKNTQDLLESILPTPIDDDAFFFPVKNINDYALGEIIEWREIKPTFTSATTKVYQLKVRSNDANNNPIAVTSTLWLPKWQPNSEISKQPVLVNNVPINSLGTKCTPGYQYANKFLYAEQPPITTYMLTKNYAVLVPDHEGPMMAYAHGTMAAHAILDSVRGLKNFSEVNLSESPIAMLGYSGGAIATGWAAELQSTYAPELEFVGAIAGGTPADFNLLLNTMNNGLGTGLFKAAILGIARQNPDMLEIANEPALNLAQSFFKDQCVELLAAAGIIALPIERLTTVEKPFESSQALAVLNPLRMGKTAPKMPVYLYHGASDIFIGDEWIPEQGVKQLQKDWCKLGGNVAYHPVAGEHVIAAITGIEGYAAWLADRFAGKILDNGC